MYALWHNLAHIFLGWGLQWGCSERPPRSQFLVLNLLPVVLRLIRYFFCVRTCSSYNMTSFLGNANLLRCLPWKKETQIQQKWRWKPMETSICRKVILGLKVHAQRILSQSPTYLKQYISIFWNIHPTGPAFPDLSFVYSGCFNSVKQTIHLDDWNPPSGTPRGSCLRSLEVSFPVVIHWYPI